MEKLNGSSKAEPKETKWTVNTDGPEVAYRTVEFGSDPRAFDAETASLFLSGVVLAVLGETASDPGKLQFIEKVVESEPSHPETATELSQAPGESSPHVKYFQVTFALDIYSLICLKLNGLVITPQSIKLLCRRPAKYSYLNDNDDLKRFIIPRVGQSGSFKGGEKCLLKNLPADADQDQIRLELEKIGKLRSLTIMDDPITGAPRRLGSFEFEESSLCKKAVALLHGKPMESTKDGVWNIYLGSGIVASAHSNGIQFSASNFSAQSTVFRSTEYLHISEIPTSMTYKVFSNPVLGLMMKYSKQVGETPSQIIQLLNIFLPEELIDDEIYSSTLDAVRTEAEVYGTILEIFCPRPDSIEGFSSCSGAGKVFIYFSDITAARRARYQFNGRVFDSIKTVSAAFYPLEKYLKREYSLVSYSDQSSS